MAFVRCLLRRGVTVSVSLLSARTPVLERARHPFWAVLQGAPADDEPVTAEDSAAIEDGRKQRGMTLDEFRAETAWLPSAFVRRPQAAKTLRCRPTPTASASSWPSRASPRATCGV